MWEQTTTTVKHVPGGDPHCGEDPHISPNGKDRPCGHSGASQVVHVVQKPLSKAGDVRDKGSIPESGRSPGGGHRNPLQYSCLENPMDRGAWRATVYEAAQSWM